MSKKLTQNPLVRIILLLLVVFVAGITIAQFMAKSMVSDFLVRKLPQHVQLVYKDIDVSVLTGTIGLTDIALDFYDRDSMMLNTTVRIDAISLKGLGYLDFLFQKKIDIRQLLLKRPEVRHYPYRVFPKKKDADPIGIVQLLKAIEIEKLSVQNGRLDVLQQSEDSIAFFVKNINFSVFNALTGPELITKKIPVVYETYELHADSLYLDLGPFEELKVSKVLWNQAQAKITGLQLRSKYDKSSLSQHLTTERDHINLNIPEMSLDAIRFGYEKDTFFIATGAGTINKPNIEIYRDKLVADDETPKKLYSQTIRQLPFHIDVPEIEIVDGKVVYSELVADVAHPGKLTFEKLNASLSNISNTYPTGDKTEIKVKTKFMDYADMTLDWSFDVNRINDAFLAAGTVSNFNTESINPFFEPNLRAKASGTIDQMYFTISGNTISSGGDMKMKYENLRFEVLKKDGSGINKFLTAVGNLFVHNNSDMDEQGFRYGTIYAKRDPTKSFFNYLWLNVREGTINTLVGKGKKAN